MRLFDWLLARAPVVSDAAPHFPAQFPIFVKPTETVDAIPPASGGRRYTLEPYFSMIEYADAQGEISQRRITMRSIEVKGSVSYLFAFCHERQAPRCFRLDRVSCLIDQDGQVEAAADWFREVLAITDSVEITPTAQRPPPFQPLPYTLLNRAVAPAVIVLSAAARSDNFLHPGEVREILIYLEDEAIVLRDAGKLPDGLDAPLFNKFERTIRRLRPTREDVAASLTLIAQWDRIKITRLATALARSVWADGIIDKTEGAIVADLTAINDRPLAGQIIVITGQFGNASRNEITERIKRFGGRISGAIAEDATILLVGDSGQSATKIAAARKRGLTLATYSNLFGDQGS